MNRKQTLGKPDQRDLNENLAATHGLAHMIQECRKLFRVSICQRARAHAHSHVTLSSLSGARFNEISVGEIKFIFFIHSQFKSAS